MKVLDRGRLHVSALACGMAQRILRKSVAYAQQRKQFGQRIGDFQLVQAMLADSQTELLAGWSLRAAAVDVWWVVIDASHGVGSSAAGLVPLGQALARICAKRRS
jgi:alkylation response protein AidB-like acyl-CoA dehydrogenase